MDLPMAGGVEEDAVVRAVATAMRAPDDVVVMPPCQPGDLVGAHRADAVLLRPEVQ